MVLWHVNSLHLAKNCNGTQKVKHYSLHSPLQGIYTLLKNSYLFQNDKHKKNIVHWDNYKYFLHLRFHSKIHSYEKVIFEQNDM